jgi:glycosyltransferase involved in cell wall biosynthesis
MNNHVKPLVSILIPLYNHERFIFQCLDSIINDPYPSKEIIILNDGSTDNSVEAVQKWQIKNKDKLSGLFFTLKTRENIGLCKTLNELVSMAQGEYVALLASDDFLLPGGIQARVDYLWEHPDKLAVFADCTVVDHEGNLTHKSGIEDLHRGRKKYLINDSLCGYELVFHWCVPGPVFMARRETYQIVGLYDETLLVEDWDYYLRLVSKNVLGFLDYPVAGYRLHNTNMVKTISKRDWIDWPLDTISKNIGRFTGIKRFVLMVGKIRKIGEKHCFNGKFITGITLRALAKLLEYIVYAIYENMVILQIKFNVALLRR